MVPNLGLLPFDQVSKSPPHSQQNQQTPLEPGMIPSLWMWNPIKDQEEDGSWEVRAFAEDTGNIMGTTWPPRSYTCSFCRREFKSAQALGGHMNVHRRDRARLHQAQAGSFNPHSHANSSILIPTQELVNNGGLCLLYQLPNPNSLFTNSRAINEYLQSSPSSTTLSISSHVENKLSSHISNSTDFPISPQDLRFFNCYNTEKVETSTNNGNSEGNKINGKEHTSNNEEVLDLELRLGHGPTISS